MEFVSATQGIDLDRTDNINGVRFAAEYERGKVTATLVDASDMELVRLARDGGESATLELIARYEARIRKLVNQAYAGAAPKTDLQQAAMLGVLTALEESRHHADPADFFTFAYFYIRGELSEANRGHSPDAAEKHSHRYYFAAMRAADNDPCVARRWSALQRLSIAELECVAEAGGADAMLAREIVDGRVDVYERHVRRGYVGTSRGRGERKPVPSWDEYRMQTGRGLDYATFDAVHAAVTYLEDGAGSGMTRLDASADTGEGDDGATGHDVTAAPDAADPFAEVENRTALAQLSATLDDREREIIARHLGGETDRAIAEALGLSRPRVVNLRTAAIARMRKLAETPGETLRRAVLAHPGFKGHPYWGWPWNGSGRA